jgi:NTP pyrophosphatase (non-canonical NTP hydrolase)
MEMKTVEPNESGMFRFVREKNHSSRDVMDSFYTYQEITGETAIYPGAKVGTYDAISYLTLGLTGEAGEIANKIKKIARDKQGEVSEDDAAEILKEAGDVLWYLARLCDELGGELSYVAQSNIDKLMDRKERGVIAGSGDNR